MAYLNIECPNIVVIEKLNVSRNMIATRQLSKIIGLVFGWCLTKNVYYEEIQASQWRSRLGMQGKFKRDEYKKMAVEYIKNLFGKHVGEDEADAICLGLGYIKMMDEIKKPKEKII